MPRLISLPLVCVLLASPAFACDRLTTPGSQVDVLLVKDGRDGFISLLADGVTVERFEVAQAGTPAAAAGTPSDNSITVPAHDACAAASYLVTLRGDPIKIAAIRDQQSQGKLLVSLRQTVRGR